MGTIDDNITDAVRDACADRCPECGSRELAYMDDAAPDALETAECGNCGHEGDESEFWAPNPYVRDITCKACGIRRSWGCGHSYEQELAAERLRAIEAGEADPVTGEAFTSAQRQHWIETGNVIDTEETYE